MNRNVPKPPLIYVPKETAKNKNPPGPMQEIADNIVKKYDMLEESKQVRLPTLEEQKITLLYKGKLKSLQNQIENLHASLILHHQMVQDKAEGIRKKDEELSKAKDEIKKLDVDIQKLQGDINALYLQLQSNYSIFDQKENTFYNQNFQLSHELKQNKLFIAKLQENLSNTESKYNQQIEIINFYQQQVMELKENISKLEIEASTSQETIQLFLKENNKLTLSDQEEKSKVKMSEELIEAQHQKLQENQERIQQLESDKEELTQHKTNQIQEIKKLKNDIEVSNGDFSALKWSAQRSEKLVTDYYQEIQDLKKENKQAKNEIENKKEKNEKLNETLAEGKEAFDEVEKKYQATLNEKTNLIRKNKIQVEKNEKLEDESKKLNKTITELKNQNKQVHDAIQKEVEKNVKLSKILEEKNQIIEVGKQKFEASEIEKNNLLQENDQLQNQIRQLMNEVANLQAPKSLSSVAIVEQKSAEIKLNSGATPSLSSSQPQRLDEKDNKDYTKKKKKKNLKSRKLVQQPPTTSVNILNLEEAPKTIQKAPTAETKSKELIPFHCKENDEILKNMSGLSNEEILKLETKIPFSSVKAASLAKKCYVFNTNSTLTIQYPAESLGIGSSLLCYITALFLYTEAEKNRKIDGVILALKKAVSPSPLGKHVMKQSAYWLAVWYSLGRHVPQSLENSFIYGGIAADQKYPPAVKLLQELSLTVTGNPKPSLKPKLSQENTANNKQKPFKK